MDESPRKRSDRRRIFILLHILHFCLSFGLIVVVIHNQLVNNGKIEKLEAKCACEGKSESLISANTTKSNDGWNVQKANRKPMTRRNLLKEESVNDKYNFIPGHRVGKNGSSHPNETSSLMTNETDSNGQDMGNRLKPKVPLDIDIISCVDKLKAFIEDHVQSRTTECKYLKGQKGDQGVKGYRGQKGCAGISFEPPTVQSVRKTTIVKEGDIAVLSCTGTANPPAKMSWYRDKIMINGQRDSNYTVTNRDITPIGSSRARSVCTSELHHPVIQSTLMVTNTSGTDTGTYICEARNFMGSSSLDTYLLVQEYADCNVIPANITAVQGGNVLLRCLASGVPNPTMTWKRKDGRMLPQDHSVVMGDLRIKNVVKEKEGTFICQATNALGSDSCEATVIVNVYPEIEAFRGNMLTANQSENMTLPCNATGYPVPEILWRKINGSLPLGRAFYDSQKLIIFNVQYQDRGKYECTARNSLGMVKNQVLVVVQVPPVITKMANSTEYGFKGETKTLEFAAFAIPKAGISWIKPFYVQDSERFRQENGSLVMENIQFTDSGHYQAVARNTLGEAKSDVFLIVREAVPATIRSLESNGLKVTVFEGGNVTKTCSAVGVPNPKITWKYKGTTLKSTTGFEITLRITNATSKYNTGKYSCIARNQFGFEEQHFELEVITKWIKVTFNRRSWRYNNRYWYKKLSNSTGQLMTYNHPGTYPDNANLGWILTSNSRIKLEFLKFSTEKCCDKVSIYDGASTYSPSLGVFSGYSLPPTIVSSSKQLFVTFKSDSSKGSSGFLAFYSAII